MKSKRRFGLIALALAIAGAIVYAFLPKSVLVETAAVARGTLETAVLDDGRTRIKDRYLVSSPLAGQLLRVELKPGHAVEQGQKLAAIEPAASDLLDPRTQAAAEARVRAADEALSQAKTLLDRASAGQDYAQNDLARVQQLFRERTVSSQEKDRAQLVARTAEEDLNAARFGARIAEHQLELARTALERGSPGANGGAIEIRAPVAGKVLRVLQESAAVVGPGTPLLELGDPQNLEVEIDVLSSDAVKIQPGARVLLEYWGGPRPLEARVRLVEPAGFLKISALGVEEQRVWVIADFVSPRAEWQNLGDAYRVEARIVTWESDNVLKIPTGAASRQKEDWAVFKVVEGRAQLQRIQAGHRGDNELEVLGGLAEGDLVIVHPSDKVASGSAVEIRK